jgi:hypothetical protein
MVSKGGDWPHTVRGTPCCSTMCDEKNREMERDVIKENETVPQ